MAWPITTIGTTHLDAGGDSPATARADIKAAVDAVNTMISHGEPLAPDGSAVYRLSAAAPSFAHRTGGQDVLVTSFALSSGAAPRGTYRVRTRLADGTDDWTAIEVAGYSAGGVGVSLIAKRSSDSAASAIYLNSDGDGGVTIAAPSGKPVRVSSGIQPTTDNAVTCGASGARWSAVWAANGTIQTSDPGLKTDIAPMALGLSFVQRVQPIVFRWIDGGGGRPGKRLHHGFDASEIKDALDAEGVADFGGYVVDAQGTQHLRPDQLLAVLWHAVQQLAAEVTELRNR